MFKARLFTLVALVSANGASAADPKFTSITPANSPPGLVRTVLVEGENLEGIVKLRLLAAQPLEFVVEKNEGKKLTGHVALPEALATGTYKLSYSKDGTTFVTPDPSLTFAVVPSNEEYVECPLALSSGNRTDGILRIGRGIACSQALLDRKEASDIFGKRIADMYLIVQINLRNLNEEFNYLLHDVGLTVDPKEGGEPILVASRTKRLVRGVAEKGQVYDTRNVIVAVVRGLGTVMGGIAATPFVTSAFSQAVNVFQGPFTSALTSQLPDFTVNQLNRLNDFGFDTNTIVVPKGGSATVIAFVSQRMFLDHDERDEFIQREKYDKQKGIRKPLVRYQARIHPAVAGFHVRRADIDDVSLSVVEPASVLASETEVTLALRGVNLDRVTKLRIRKSNGASAEGSIQLKDPLDTTKATVKIKPNIAADTYNVYLLEPGGTEKPTSVSFTIGAKLPSISDATPDRALKSVSVPVKLTVTDGALIENIDLVQNDAEDKGITFNWTSKLGAEWSGTLTAGTSAKDGEHLWRITPKDAKPFVTAKKITIAPPTPGPLLLRVTVPSVTIGAAETDITFEGERLTGVAFQARQNGAVDDKIKLTIDDASRTDKKVSGKLKAEAGALVGDHLWFVKPAGDAVETVQRLGVVK